MVGGNPNVASLAGTGMPSGTPRAAAPAAPTTPAPAPAGPAGWNNDWARRFHDAGVDPGTMQQLNVLGGAGMADEELEGLLAQSGRELDAAIAKLKEQHPLEYQHLVELGPAKMPKWQLAQLAQEVTSGKISEQDFVTQVETLTMRSPSGMKRMFLYDVVPYALPGWGLWSTAYGFAEGAKNGEVFDARAPFSHRRLTGTTMDWFITPMLAAGGFWTVSNLVLGHMNARRGQQLAARSPEAMQVVEGAGLRSSEAGRASLNPFSRNAKTLGAVSVYEAWKGEAERLQRQQPGTELAERARMFMDDWRKGGKAGGFNLVADSPVRFLKLPFPGFFSQTRGILPMIGNRGKELAKAATLEGVPSLVMDPRGLRGPAAHSFALALGGYSELMSNQGHKLNEAAKARYLDGMPARGYDPTRRVSHSVAAETARALSPEGSIPKPGSAAYWTKQIRPGVTADVAKHLKHLDAGTIGKMKLFERVLHTAGPKWQSMGAGGRVGVVSAAVGSVFLGTFGLMKLLGGSGGAQQAAAGAGPAPWASAPVQSPAA